MAPVRSYSNWNSRYPTKNEAIEPYCKYFILCEGANTERWYFEKFISLRKEMNIHSLIDVVFLEKTNEDKDISFPRHLVEFANKQKKNPDLGFDPERDHMIVVFDADIFEEKCSGYDELLKYAESKDIILAVTNPSFELFLLLHYNNSYFTDIQPHSVEILANKKTGRQTYIYNLLLKRTSVNSKKNSTIGNLARNVDIAIQQELNLNQNIHECKGQITSNVGQVIQMIKDADKEYSPHFF